MKIVCLKLKVYKTMSKNKSFVTRNIIRVSQVDLPYPIQTFVFMLMQFFKTFYQNNGTYLRYKLFKIYFYFSYVL